MAAARLSDRNFGLSFAAVFGLIATVGWFVIGSYYPWVVGTALAFLSTALVWPTLLLPLNRLWEQLGHCLGRVSNSIILSTFFYAVITPVGVLMRLIGTDPMHRRMDRGADSYFTPIRRQASPETFPDMF